MIVTRKAWLMAGTAIGSARLYFSARDHRWLPTIH